MKGLCHPSLVGYFNIGCGGTITDLAPRKISFTKACFRR